MYRSLVDALRGRPRVSFVLPLGRWCKLLWSAMIITSVPFPLFAELPPSTPVIAIKAYSVNKDQIEVSVDVPTGPVALAAFTFSITVTNRSSAPYEVMQIDSLPYYVISVFTKDGHECERTPEGSTFGPHSLGGWQTKNIVVAPGKAHTWKIPLQSLFVLPPGKYKMKVESRNHRRKIDGIEFTIQG